MKLIQPDPQRMPCWCCGNYPAVTTRPWNLYLINYDKRKYNDHALGQITTVDMPLCSVCDERLRKSKKTTWVVGLTSFLAGYFLCIILTVAGVLDLTMAEALKVGAVIGLLTGFLVTPYYAKKIHRRNSGFHPDNLNGHPIFGFFYDYGWGDSNFGSKTKYKTKFEEDYRVNYVNYLRWLQYNYGYRIIDDSNREVDLTTPEFSGVITPELARRVAISFTTDTNFRTHDARNLRQSQMN